ncbi:neutral trehalase [Psychrobacillus sp. INOP01]|uniref:pyrimidine dimer DNA glycosylase/endonuclease V n=1 Tax=Psychrobacillus sp. INOP01 TaxID=2829187 RepID=UPI001BAE2282|nr:pyrimidine dimer DNA glycosylase/endonuclease V [Psychrobacillus sp. INOP01]QUG43101.1 neutral trehalase [Psychrobacillus sp. INOP01]
MRLWHQNLLSILPKSQLLAQWRELNSIFAKEDRHILINYIYDYSKDDLFAYTQLVLYEMRARSINIRTIDKMERYFGDESYEKVAHPFVHQHNEEYLEICYFNLKEKFMRGQKDFDAERYEALRKIYCLSLCSKQT